ncbi:molybdenum cofactor guanylyltransferase [Herpetosiphon giganteus]|uniref:molybdenum cofactor guanylyltransferase n=1 Tax=Herpetosiphon giganteus TaxID=2029754 RepID=UPI00195B3FAE|nr:molybdenum cofactor guanylyltransferase [Herpetosiphon giganteus]MBM7846158.1 molybdopterin-guanine dinucleotide biosynthesis protein A [Herpetosiphon giganteus]
MPIDLSCVIIAGGQARRFGSDKRRLRLWGEAGPTLLEHTLAVAQTVCAQVVVSLNDPSAWPELGVPLVQDRYANAGPLAGIVAGMQHFASEWTLVLAADLPLLATPFLAELLAQPRHGLAVVPQIQAVDQRHAGWEPLCALYQRAALPYFEQALAAGQHQLIRIIAQLPPQIWPIASASPWLQCLHNLNRLDDMQQLAAFKVL